MFSFYVSFYRAERRFFLATEDACLPNAVRTDFGRCEIVRFLFAAAAAFLMFFRAALFCFVDAIAFPLKSAHIILRCSIGLRG